MELESCVLWNGIEILLGLVMNENDLYDEKELYFSWHGTFTKIYESVKCQDGEIV